MTETEIDTSTLEHLDFEVACESIGHVNGMYQVTVDGVPAWFKGHGDDGPAKWRMTNRCPMCAYKTDVLVCEARRLRAVNAVRRQQTCTCTECGVVVPYMSFEFRFVPINEVDA